MRSRKNGIRNPQKIIKKTYKRGGEQNGRYQYDNNCDRLRNCGNILRYKNNNRRNKESEKTLINRKGKYYEGFLFKNEI